MQAEVMRMVRGNEEMDKKRGKKKEILMKGQLGGMKNLKRLMTLLGSNLETILHSTHRTTILYFSNCEDQALSCSLRRLIKL